jgi:hypothetical protein
VCFPLRLYSQNSSPFIFVEPHQIVCTAVRIDCVKLLERQHQRAALEKSLRFFDGNKLETEKKNRYFIEKDFLTRHEL